MPSGACRSRIRRQLPGQVAQRDFIRLRTGGKWVDDVGQNPDRHLPADGDAGLGNPVIGTCAYYPGACERAPVPVGNQDEPSRVRPVRS